MERENNKKNPHPFLHGLTLLDALFSLAFGGVLFFEAFQGNPLLYAIAPIFVVESLLYFLLFFHKGKASAIGEFLLSPIAMVALLLLVFLRGEGAISLPMQIGIYAFAAIKVVTLLIFLFQKKGEDIAIPCGKDIRLIGILYLLNFALSLLWPNPEEGVVIVLAIKVVVNALSTFPVAYLSLSFLAKEGSGRNLTMKETFVETASYVTRHRLPFFASEFFSLFLMSVAFVNVSKNPIYIVLALFYMFVFVLRLVSFLMDKKIRRSYENKPKRQQRELYWILLLNAVSFGIFGQGLTVALAVLSGVKASSSVPLWWFLAFLLPFAIYSFLMSLLSRKRVKKERDGYQEATSLQGLIFSFYSLFATLCFFLRYLSEGIRSWIWISSIVGISLFQTFLVIYSFIISIMGLVGARRPKKEKPPMSEKE